MITKSHLLKNFNELDKLYNGATNKENDKQAIYYSKLALLELCGWIEESMDDIIRGYSNPKLKGKDNKEYLKNDIIGRNNGFSYTGFREILVKTIGIIQLEKLEIKLEKQKIVFILKEALKRISECS